MVKRWRVIRSTTATETPSAEHVPWKYLFVSRNIISLDIMGRGEEYTTDFHMDSSQIYLKEKLQTAFLYKDSFFLLEPVS